MGKGRGDSPKNIPTFPHSLERAGAKVVKQACLAPSGKSGEVGMGQSKGWEGEMLGVRKCMEMMGQLHLRNQGGEVE